MGFFSGKNKVKIKGFKDLTNTKDIFEYLEPKIVAIPLRDATSETFDVHVKIGDYVKIGTNIATRKDHFVVPIFSSVSGFVKDIKEMYHVSGKIVNHIVIENDFKDEKQELFNPKENFENIPKNDIVEYIKKLGVMGLGGAGFPTYVKYNTDKKVDTILINGIECEPYITSDEINIKKNAEFLIEGTLLLMRSVDAKNGIIGIKENKPSLYKVLTESVLEHKNIKIVQTPDVYPMGWERLLLRQTLKREYDKLPIEVGVIVSNASTVIEFSKSLKTGLPAYERIITISGNGFVKNQNVKVRIGTILKEIIQEMGGYKGENLKLIYGGPMMGNTLDTDEVAITSIASSFLCMEEEKKEEPSPCLRCSRCVDYCPCGLQPVALMNAGEQKEVNLLRELSAFKCTSCGVCSYVCPSKIDVTEGVSKARDFYLSLFE
ncbi:MAG: RnfABCDGE type electron transport complex subunit C [Defluviitaleaceae bacterium]|nr:RnfABCDGE type electron transport complex subunit C [Defluviitaleaceae bacterium]